MLENYVLPAGWLKNRATDWVGLFGDVALGTPTVDPSKYGRSHDLAAADIDAEGVPREIQNRSKTESWR